jgi:hypothetical protein
MLSAYLHPYIGSEFHPVFFATAHNHPHLASAYCKRVDSHHRSTENVFSMKRNPQSWDWRYDESEIILFGNFKNYLQTSSKPGSGFIGMFRFCKRIVAVSTARSYGDAKTWSIGTSENLEK